MMTIESLRDDVLAGYKDYIGRTWTSSPQAMARASSIGYECLVRHVLFIHKGSELPPPSLEKRGTFWTGQMTESDVNLALGQASKHAKWDMIGQQQALQLRRRINALNLTTVILTGHMDHRISCDELVDDKGQRVESIPFECKNLRAEVWDRLEGSDMAELNEVWSYSKSWTDQLQSYMLMTNAPFALLFVCSKQHRMAHAYAVKADKAAQKGIVQRSIDIFLEAQKPLDQVLAGARYREDECEHCPHFKMGLCPVKEPDPKLAIQDLEVRQRAAQLLEERAAAKALMRGTKEEPGPEAIYERASKELKRILKGVPKVVLEGVDGKPGWSVEGGTVKVAPKDGYEYWRYYAKRLPQEAAQ